MTKFVNLDRGNIELKPLLAFQPRGGALAQRASFEYRFKPLLAFLQ